MRTLLIHISRTGRAMGIFDEDGQYFYFREFRDHVADGVRMSRARGGASWADWVENLSEKTQSRRGMWTGYDTEESLENALVEFSRYSNV